jgi:type I restriction enzyme, S subunit
VRLERLRHVAEIRVSSVDKKSVDGEVSVHLCNYMDVYYNERITATLDFMEATASPDQCLTFQLEPGDVLLTKDSETPDDIGVCAVVAETRPRLLCGYHLALIRPRPLLVNGRYLRYALTSSPAKAEMASRAMGITRYGLRSSAIGDITIPLPELALQRTIADYLDRETTRIDALIENKVVLSAILGEKLACEVAAATHAACVARQDRDGAPTDWHWLPLRRCFAVVRYGIGEPTVESGAVAVLGMANVAEGRVIGSPIGYVSSVEPILELMPGDLLFNRTNSLALVGKVGRVQTVSERTTIASYLVLVRTNALAESAYLNLLLNTQAVLGLVRSMALPSIGQANLNPSRYGAIWIIVPSPETQREIVLELALKYRDVDLAREKLDAQVTLLSEKRQALITAAVAGQLDIPSAA